MPGPLPGPIPGSLPGPMPRPDGQRAPGGASITPRRRNIRRGRRCYNRTTAPDV